jgi:hypothetical protein
MVKNMQKAGIRTLDQQVVKLANLIGAGFKNPAIAQGILKMYSAEVAFRALVAELAAKAANDNYRTISCHMAEQLIDILAFTVKKRGQSVDVVSVAMCIEFGVPHLSRLREDQVSDALDYILMNKVVSAF